MKARGFTLIELLVVISIIGFLSSVVIASLNSARIKGRDARRFEDIRQIQAALELYYLNNGAYPNPTAVGCGGNPAWSSWGCWSSLIPSTYIGSMPVDPLNSDLLNCATTQNCHIYEYCAINSGASYVLAVNLENAPASSRGNPTSLGCPNGGPNWYWVQS